MMTTGTDVCTHTQIHSSLCSRVEEHKHKLEHKYKCKYRMGISETERERGERRSNALNICTEILRETSCTFASFV